MNPEPVTNGLTDFLSLPARDERGEGVPGTVGPIYPLPKRPSSPRPSPPSEGGEGEERNLSRCQEAHYPPRKDQSLLTSAPTDHGASAHQDSLGAALESQATRSADAHVRELDTQRERADVGVRAPPGATEARGLDDEFQRLLDGTEPILALAPMQDVTDQPFWRLMASYGGADVYYTEYFRVHATSTLDKYILKSITDNPTGRPVIAQMIGNDICALIRIARELQNYPIVAVDLNLGCPAPVVYRKCAGGGLLREPERVDAILGALREAISIKFTVKTRLGFDSSEVFEELLPIFAKHSIDLLTVHGRTVKEMYWSDVHYDLITRAVQSVPCPVLANGNVYSAQNAEAVLVQTGARGLMIGRGAIRNPWLFQQIRERRQGKPALVPSGKDVLGYVRALYEAVKPPEASELALVQKMKKYLNFVGMGVEPTGQFLHEIRRVATEAEFFRVCEAFLDHEEPMALEPFG